MGPVVSRRSLLAGAAGAAMLLGLGGGARYAWAVSEHELLRPPGGQDAERLTSLCIHCDRCRQACPMGAIESCSIEDGLLNVRTPKVNFRQSAVQRTLGTNEYHEATTGYCNFCDPDGTGCATKKCIAACPTGALAAFDETCESIGKAVIDPVFCINYPQMGQSPTGCRLCIDACSYEAIVMNDLQRPEVIADMCNGCGKCEMVCPSGTYLAHIGESALAEQAAAGVTDYQASLAYLRTYGVIPRGINVLASEA